MDQISKRYSLTSKEVFALMIRHHFIFYRIFYYILFAIELILLNQKVWDETDILILCIPLVIPIGMTYWIWVESRSDSSFLKRVTHFQVNSQQFNLSDEEGNSSVILWTFVRGVKKYSGLNVIYFKNNTMIFIPRHVLTKEEEICLSKWAKDAKSKVIES